MQAEQVQVKRVQGGASTGRTDRQIMEGVRVMLQGKNIILAVTGSIAAYKIANLASMLKKLEADVTVLMTKKRAELYKSHYL